MKYSPSNELLTIPILPAKPNVVAVAPSVAIDNTPYSTFVIVIDVVVAIAVNLVSALSIPAVNDATSFAVSDPVIVISFILFTPIDAGSGADAPALY